MPNRFEYGYGLTPELVEVAAQSSPGIIVTVDNGISSHAGVAAAAELGIDTIVTDHHLPGPTQPAAVAVVNPNRADCTFASKHLAGVGVVFTQSGSEASIGSGVPTAGFVATSSRTPAAGSSFTEKGATTRWSAPNTSQTRISSAEPTPAD